MDQFAPSGVSPYQVFTRDQWAGLRADTPMTLTASELDDLRGLNERMSLHEVETIYLPLSRLIRLHFEASQELALVTRRFLGTKSRRVPFIIGMAGSVAVGKSTTARVLRALLAGIPGRPKVELITTDGFLLPNAVLKAEDLMERKGFPESYDVTALLKFLTDIKAGKKRVRAPRYSHLVYDVLKSDEQRIDAPDILIVEGLNVLQPARLPADGKAIPFVSDFFDYSVYVDADEAIIRQWYVKRFMRLRETAFQNPKSFFHRYASLSDEEARETSLGIWERINLPNLRENILPTRQRADLILHKGDAHAVEAVALRRL
ncbi:MAG: type I pantothenate kinase [Pseudomonadota bacterium]